MSRSYDISGRNSPHTIRPQRAAGGDGPVSIGDNVVKVFDFVGGSPPMAAAPAVLIPAIKSSPPPVQHAVAHGSSGSSGARTSQSGSSGTTTS